MPTLKRDESVFVLHLGDGENRFTLDWLASVNSALDEVEQAEGPRALVTAATGKFYSYGLDLDWLSVNTGARDGYLGNVRSLLARMLSFPVVTVAAVQGHAFGAGAMLSLAHDFRVMRADRGFWCLPEADLNLPIPAGMCDLVQARLTPQVAHEAMVTSRRYGGQDALAAGIADRAVDEHAVLSTAIEIAAGQAAKGGGSIAAIKSRIYAPVLAALRVAQ